MLVLIYSTFSCFINRTVMYYRIMNENILMVIIKIHYEWEMLVRMMGVTGWVDRKLVMFFSLMVLRMVKDY